MPNKVVSIKEATERWVNEFRPFSGNMVQALMEAAINNKEREQTYNSYSDTWTEVTPPRMPEVGDRVLIRDIEDFAELEDENGDEIVGDVYGEIIDADETEDLYVIGIEGTTDTISLCSGEFEDTDVEKEPNYSYCEDCVCLPMYGTLWQFGDSLDDDWLEQEGGLQIMANYGFRIYKSEEFGYFFGIDGVGYDFYEQHWIPLYKARGLKYHTEDAV